MNPQPYKTLMKRGSDEFVVNKSRFIGYGAPAESEEEALSFLSEIRAKHRDASHNCYAYILGSNMGVMRYSDDGEPGGTAGLPIIELLKARGVTNCCAVVTRYFGGVLLGAGGLVRAYTQGAAAALNAAGVGTMYPTSRLLADLSYPLLGRVEHCLKDKEIRLEDKSFTDRVTLTLLVKSEAEAALIEALAAATDGRCECLKIEELFLPWS